MRNSLFDRALASGIHRPKSLPGPGIELDSGPDVRTIDRQQNKELGRDGQVVKHQSPLINPQGPQVPGEHVFLQKYGGFGVIIRAKQSQFSPFLAKK
jgi:hypothetical protein